MRSLNKKKFEEQGYAIVKNVLNFDNDLKPILNDMEYVMDRLIHKFSPKHKILKALKLKFEKKYQFVSSLNIFDLDQYFNTRLPRDHVKKDSDYFATHSLWNLIKHKKILSVVEKSLVQKFFPTPFKIQELSNQKKHYLKNQFLMV